MLARRPLRPVRTARTAYAARTGCAAALLAAAIVLSAPARSETPLADPALEAEAAAVFREVRCLVCEGESLSASRAPFASELRGAIRLRIQEGMEREEVLAWLGAAYGPEIFASPAREGWGRVLWLWPFLVAAAAAAAWASWLARQRSGKDGEDGRPPARP